MLWYHVIKLQILINAKAELLLQANYSALYIRKIKRNRYIMLVADSLMVLVYYEWRLCTECLEGPADPRSSCTWSYTWILSTGNELPKLNYSAQIQLCQLLVAKKQYTGCTNKNNPLGKINYLSYCNRFFNQIYSFHRGGFRPHKQQISLQYLYLLWCKNYNHLNLKLQKWTSNVNCSSDVKTRNAWQSLAYSPLGAP